MSRREVVEIICDRCDRTETRIPEEVREGLLVDMTFKGETVKYEDLCRRCEDTIGNQFMRMTKQKDEDGKEDSAPAKKPSLLSRAMG